MESYYKTTNILYESGKTQLELENAPWWSTDIFALSDTGQILDNLQTREGNRESWVYVAGLNQYFRNDRSSHGFIKALQTAFTPERWEEIEHLLDDMQANRLLGMGNRPRLKKKVIRARDNGWITAAEVTTMNNILSDS